MVRSMITMPKDPSFWEGPAQVERFAALEPDELLLDLLSERRGTDRPRALDLGCAGGRNTEALVRAGCQTVAIDLSVAMSRTTRDRLAQLGASAAHPPMVIRGRFDRLPLASARFDLVVAIGIYVQADSDAELRAALAETRRVVKPDGRVLAAMWSTQTLPEDARRVEGQRFVYASQPGETRCRLNQDELLELMAQGGMFPDRPITTRHPIRDGRPHESLVGVFVKQ